MSADRDYYAALGILPDAADVVVRAAFRALAQRYHPDRCDARESAHARMCELNEAYAVLSDPAQRRAYDDARAAAPPPRCAFAEVDDEPAAYDGPFDRDWRVATQYCGELAVLEERLRRFSWRLACAYRACLLEARDFDGRRRLAGLLEDHFLISHFGTQPRSLAFARNLIIAGERRAALALNEAVRIFGAAADPGMFLSRIAHAHAAWRWLAEPGELRAAIDALHAAPTTQHCLCLLHLLGGRHRVVEADPIVRAGSDSAAWHVDFGAESMRFRDSALFRRWGREQLLPLARSVAR